MSPKLSILDVGHGNAAVLMDTQGVVVIDAGLGSTLLEYLAHVGIKEIRFLLLSHADADHIGGAVALVSQPDIRIDTICLNADRSKKTVIFEDLLFALRDRRRANQTKIEPQLSSALTGKLDCGAVRIEVLSPSPESVLAGGAGSTDLDGDALTSNTMSGVFRLVESGRGVALLAGDMDALTLKSIENDGHDLTSSVLVFPHHGGRVRGADAGRFAAKLTDACRPSLVVFSIGRDKHENPQPEIVKSIMALNGAVRIACTQLSKRCAEHIPPDDPIHLTASPAKGKEHRKCCAGNVDVEIGTGNVPISVAPSSDGHAAYIALVAPTALCKINA